MGFANTANEKSSRMAEDARHNAAENQRAAESVYEDAKQRVKNMAGRNTAQDQATYYANEAQRQAAGVKDAAHQYGQHGVSYSREELNEMGERINQLSEQMRQQIESVGQDTNDRMQRMLEMQQAQLENLRDSVRTGDWSKKAGEYMPNVNAYKDEDSNQYCVSAGQKGAHSCAPAYGVWGAMALVFVMIAALVVRRQQPQVWDKGVRSLQGKTGQNESTGASSQAARDAERANKKGN